MAKASVLDRIRQLDEEKAKLMEGAKSEVMERVNAAIAELNELGFNFRLTEGGRDGGRKGTRTIKDAPCPVCKFKTYPLHDKRSHRTQKTKKPFSQDELDAKGLVKV